MFEKLVGVALLVVGIYLLGQNIVVTTGFITSSRGDLLATVSILSLMLGAIALLFFRRETGNLGGILIAVGLVSVFLSGRIILKPTSLWYFFLSFASLASGLKLLGTRGLHF
ncbi:MAG: hypothetical protein J7642_12360 [Cyanobacteria bacterium SBC]|nr:hypothetical protein [Cyanobacteria bacterium SBC]